MLGPSALTLYQKEHLLPLVSEHAVLNWRPESTGASQPVRIDLGASPLHILLDGLSLVFVEV
jgi:hypothetical protein